LFKTIYLEFRLIKNLKPLPNIDIGLVNITPNNLAFQQNYKILWKTPSIGKLYQIVDELFKTIFET